MAHFGVNNFAVGCGEYLARFEAKCALQPCKRSAIVLIYDRRNKCRAVRVWGSHRLLLYTCPNMQYLTILIIILSTARREICFHDVSLTLPPRHGTIRTLSLGRRGSVKIYNAIG